MGLGAKVRRLFGPLEPKVADLYRSYFIDLDQMAKTAAGWAPNARQVLEIGCGEGSLTERVSRQLPEATCLGIDVMPQVGRLFRGDRSRVRFQSMPVQELAKEGSARFDLILLCDVLHHAPWSIHDELLSAAHQLLVPGGVFVLKDWERANNVAHLLCWGSDRFVTGDRVKYLNTDQLERLAERTFGPGSIEQRERIAPHQNNVALLVRKALPA